MTDWPPRHNSTPPNPENAARFQAALNRIAGFAHERYPRLMLFWGQTMRERDQFPDSPGFDTGDVLRHRYSLQEVCTGWVVTCSDEKKWFPPSVEAPQLPEGYDSRGNIVEIHRQTVERDIGINRYFIHGWRSHTKEDAKGWERDNSVFEDGKTIWTGPQVMPPGQWSVVLHTIVSNPTGGCCAVAKLRREKCFHGYREPGQDDLDYLAAMWYEQIRRPVYFAEGDVAPPWLIEQRTREKLSAIADSKQRAHAETRMKIASALKDARHRLFDMPRSGYSVATGRMMPTGKNVR